MPGWSACCPDAGRHPPAVHHAEFSGRVTWTVRARDDRQETDLHGQVEAEFRSGKVATLRLGGFTVSQYS